MRWLVGLSLALVAAAALATLRITRIQILPGAGDYALSVTNPPLGGVATLHPGDVVHFTLTSNASAGGFRITDNADGTASGDGLVYGQIPTAGDFTGAYPNLSLVDPNLRGVLTYAPSLLAPGDCQDDLATVTGAAPGMAAQVTTPSSGLVPPRVTSAGWVSGIDQVTVRTCALAAAELDGSVVQVIVIR